MAGLIAKGGGVLTTKATGRDAAGAVGGAAAGSVWYAYRPPELSVVRRSVSVEVAARAEKVAIIACESRETVLNGESAAGDSMIVTRSHFLGGSWFVSAYNPATEPATPSPTATRTATPTATTSRTPAPRPQRPLASIQQPADGARICHNNDVQFAGTARTRPDGEDIVGDEFTRRELADWPTGHTAVMTGTHGSFLFKPNAGPGEHGLTFTATDARTRLQACAHVTAIIVDPR